MTIRIKYWFFQNHWWLMLLAILAVISFMLFKKADYKTIATLLGVLLSLFYFLQKQRLEEMKLFREIFAECNKRYDDLNERLGLIVNGNNEQELSLEERQTLTHIVQLNKASPFSLVLQGN